jgi:glycosyltransferase involved in cell wall biosynthesis
VELQKSLEVAPVLIPRELARRMAESMLMVFPSHYEGFGLVALESMAVGTPVIMSDAVGLAEWMGSEEMAIVTPLDPNRIVAECQRLLDDEPLRIQLATRASGWAGKFTWVLAAERTAQVYAQAVAGRRGN